MKKLKASEVARRLEWLSKFLTNGEYVPDMPRMREACNYAAAYLRRAEPENKALTLEELRKMGGEPVWIVLLNIAKQPRCEIVTEVHEDGIWMACADDDNDYAAFGLYGKTWLAYARKPEGSENNGSTI